MRLRILAAGIAAALLTFCTGFTLPSPTSLREDIKKELARIREKSPGAKQLARWRHRYEEAISSIKQAERQSAQRLAPDAWNEALNMLSRAKEYARQKSYLKAEFLARKAAEAANRAREISEKARADSIAKARRITERLKKRLDQLKNMIPKEDAELTRRVNELTIRWADLVHAIKLDQFKEVEKGARSLDNDIKKLSKRISHKHS